MVRRKGCGIHQAAFKRHDMLNLYLQQPWALLKTKLAFDKQTQAFFPVGHLITRVWTG